MSIFFDILSAINNPNQQATVSQLASIMNSVHNLGASRGVQPVQMQNMMSVVGNLIRPVLQQQRATMGSSGLENLISQAVNSGSGGGALQSLFSPQLMQQFAQTVALKTGMNPDLVQTSLPTALSTVLSFLNMGAPKPGTWGGNPLLNAFLDGDGDGDTDLGDVMKFANRFLNPAAA